jgi:hypothetical protein
MVVTNSVYGTHIGKYYEMVCEWNIRYGVDVWGLSEAWKLIDKVIE